MAGKGGGAWKVAYADFVTAMMAFFLVMWLVGQSKDVKSAVARHFSGPFHPSASESDSEESGGTTHLPLVGTGGTSRQKQMGQEKAGKKNGSSVGKCRKLLIVLKAASKGFLTVKSDMSPTCARPLSFIRSRRALQNSMAFSLRSIPPTSKPLRPIRNINRPVPQAGSKTRFTLPST